MDKFYPRDKVGVRLSKSFSDLRDTSIMQDYDVPSHYDVPRRIYPHHTINSRTWGSTNVLDLSQGSDGDDHDYDELEPISDPEEEDPKTSSLPSATLPREMQGPMSIRDQAIYNSLGSSSSKTAKPSYAQLGLTKQVIKNGIMSKTGPSPSWVSKWNRRVFVLKGNFLFYFDPTDKPLPSAPVLGAIYIKDAMIEKSSLPFARRVLKITPPVPRRVGWLKQHDSEVFFIKFRSNEGRNEWYDALMGVSLGHS